MAEIATIARPYAEAAFRQAEEQGRLAQWHEALELLAAAVENEPLASYIAYPALSSKQKAELLEAVLGDSALAEMRNFVALLAENGRLAILPAIAQSFAQLKANAEGVREAVIQSAFPLDEAQTQALLPVLEKHFHGRLRPRIEIDPELIGGVRVLVGDQMLDASVRGKLDAMKSALTP